MKILFIGAGKMATAIAKGMVEKGGYKSSSLAAIDIYEQARVAFSATTGIECYAQNEDAIKDADVIILAVKPQVAQDAVANIAKFAEDKLIISIAAGITISTLGSWFNSERVIRVMPNTPLMIGLGASAFAAGQKVSDNDCKIIESIFNPIGTLIKVDESKMDAVTALSGSGPAYVFEMIQAMCDAGIDEGLDSDDALELSLQTIIGAATMVKLKMGTPDDLRDAVTSPGGTTAAGLAELKKANFRSIIANTIKAAKKRSIELSKA